MKLIGIILKVLGGICIFLSLLAFIGDFMPVEGISFGSHQLPDGTPHYYTIVPTEDGFDVQRVGVFLLFVGLALFAVVKLLTKRKLN